MLLAVFAVGLAFSFFTLFSRFSFWDDEGKLMLFTKHLLEGKALYDQLHFIYGPTYALERWMILSWLGVPLTNDGVRFVTLVTWELTALVLAATAWRLARDTGWAVGLAAVVWLAATLYLFVFANEPGHPQELVALLLALSFWIAATLLEKRTGTALALLGALTALLVLTKINVGVLFGLGLGMSFVSLGPRPSALWTLLRAAGALAILALPTILMRSRLWDGYGPFCFAITAALLPCCLFVLVGVQPSMLGFRHLLQCGLGAAVAVCVTVGFALAHGNTLGGLVQALVIQPMQGFALVKYGWALALPPAIAYWSAAGAAIGLAALWSAPQKRRFLWLLRIFVCAMILVDVLFVDSRDSLATWTTLPLMWLLLVPPTGYEPRPTEWFFRLFLAFTACLQPIQIFPFPGSQVRIGTMSTLLVGVMLVVDLYHELRGGDLLDQFRDRLSELDWNLILASAALLVGCQAAFTQGLIYQRYVPLDLPGCRWTRFPEKEAVQLAFVTANVRASSDCVVARIGLMSLDFWTDRSPPGTFVFGNEWDSLDPATNDLLLSTFGDDRRMMFVDNPKPWYLKTHNLPFSSFVGALPAHKFLDFVSDHFKQLARVSSCRLLVRKERTDLDLLDCAYTAGSDARHRGNLLRVKLPEGANLREVTRVEMVDVQTGTWIASTDFDEMNPVLNLLDGNGHETLHSLIRMQGYASFQARDDLFLSYPARLNLERMSYPVLRFIDSRGKRLLTLPVAVETCLANPPPFEQPPVKNRPKAGSTPPAIPPKTH
ncbi:MAG TPA: hypothetical protein VFG04_26370 [Planctomycetaceae bacterium]|nr:hypothetical protein [Planctomycetaceae bacterium]